MSDNNWIKLNRSIWNCFLWNFEKPKYVMCWIDMLLMANYRDKKVLFNGNIELIPRGSFVTSMVKLSKRWCMDRATVKRFLNHLVSDGMITYTCNKRKTTVTIVKYDVYQMFITDDTSTDATTDTTTDTTTESSTESSTDSTTDATQHKKIKRNIKKKDITKVISKEKSERFVPPTEEDVRCYCQERGYTNVDPGVFVDFYECKGWMVGKNRMKDWKAAVRNWSRSQRQELTAKTKDKKPETGCKNSFHNFPQRENDCADIERMILDIEMDRCTPNEIGF